MWLLIHAGLSHLSEQDLDDLVTVTRASGLHLLFELNMQLRAGDQYDPTNVIEILEYFQEKGYGDNVDFELGNGECFKFSAYEQFVILDLGKEIR